MYVQIDTGPVTSVAFDHSGVYLAVGSNRIDSGSVVSVKTIKDFLDLVTNDRLVHSKIVTGLAWGPDARFLVSSSADNTIKIHGSLSS